MDRQLEVGFGLNGLGGLEPGESDQEMSGFGLRMLGISRDEIFKSFNCFMVLLVLIEIQRVGVKVFRIS